MPSTKKLLQAAAGNAGGDNLYVEDVFSTYLYDGNSSTQTITNDIDLDGEGGLVWMKARDYGTSNYFFDTERGVGNYLRSNSNSNSSYDADMLTDFNSNGFSLSSDTKTNNTLYKYASWTFRKAEKFFDVVTYTGDGNNNRQVAHSLGVTPACIIVKNTSTSATNWAVWHKDSGAGFYAARLNTTDTFSMSAFGPTDPFTDSYFTVKNEYETNISGDSYVAYVFASDAGGFGDDGSESIIKCGSFTTDASGSVSVNLGFEPQWLLVKNSQITENWVLLDSMRGWSFSSQQRLFPNLSNAEQSLAGNYGTPTATGFDFVNGLGNSNTYIYIAIRRPMKTPESGTEVFSPYTYQDATLTSGSGTASNRTILNGGVNGGTNFPVDLFMGVNRTGNHPYALHVFDRLRGKGKSLLTNATTAEPAGDGASNSGFDFQEGVDVEYTGQFYYYTTAAGNRTHIAYFLKRATGFFDVVAYTGNGTAGRTVAHNLGVAPELMIVKRRVNTGNWPVYHASVGATQYADLNQTNNFAASSGYWNNTAPTDAVFTVGNFGNVNYSGEPIIAYLFATLAGVSKVGSYTGTGSNVDVDCGFSAGARFILIKRTDSTGDWYYWDSARGITAGNDPYQLINSTAAEVTNTDYIDPLNAGFTVTSSAPAALNASGGNYIFLAIA